MGKISLLIFLISSTNLYAGITASTLSSKKGITLARLHSKYNNYKTRLDVANDELHRLEKVLGKENRNLLTTIKKKKKIELDLFNLSSEISVSGNEIEEKNIKIKKVLKGLLINSMADDGNSKDLFGKKILTLQIKKTIKDLDDQRRKLIEDKKQLTVLNTRFAEYQKSQVSISRLLSDLEYKKSKKAAEFIRLESKKDFLEVKLSKANKRHIKRKSKKNLRKAKVNLVNMTFKTPITEYVSMEHEDKGVTFNYRGEQAIKAARDGKVVYSGQLSKYGNVVMIDHGNETRSIILGNFISNVKKGSKITSGKLIGRTRDLGRKKGKIYFEVRKKDKAQKTIALIDKTTLKRPNS